jgi:hypothetical protein
MEIRTILLHEWAEVPIGNPVTKQFARSGDRCHARAIVNEGDLAEIVAWLQGGMQSAAHCIASREDSAELWFVSSHWHVHSS